MKLANHFAEISVQPLGAMLHDCVFRLENGLSVLPLYDAPWRGATGSDFDAQPPIIQQLGSEWPCVPFGRPVANLHLPDEWVTSDAKPWDNWAHGYSANHDWVLEQQSDTLGTATIDYPDNSPVAKLEREVGLMEDRPGLALSLTIKTRRKISLPLGLHPILSMAGAAPGALSLQVAETARVWSFPIDVEPGRSHFVPNQQKQALDNMQTYAGDVADVRVLPPVGSGSSEDLLLLTDTGGLVGLVNPIQGCITTIQWDSAQIPGCILWISNGGRDYYPWNSRVAALGIEPVAAAFDLGMGHSLSQHTPLARNGIATAISVTPEHPFQCHYQILIDPL